MQSTNPIVPARRGSFVLALAVTFAPLIMGGEVALAEDQPCTAQPPSSCSANGPCQLSINPQNPTSATFRIKNNFSAANELYGSSPTDAHFWIYCGNDGKGQWYYKTTCGNYQGFCTGCYVNLANIADKSISVQGNPLGALIQAIYWPFTSPPPNPPLTSPPSSGSAPSPNTGSYAGYAMLEVTVNGDQSNVDLTVLDRYSFPHQLLYWQSDNCAQPGDPSTPPNTASGFNGKYSQAQIYTALINALDTQQTPNGYYPAYYPDPSLMQLNGAPNVSDWNHYAYNRQTEQWTGCGGGLLNWGLPKNYLSWHSDSNADFNNGVSPSNAVAQNFPIDTGAYSNTVCGVWHPSKSFIATSSTGVNVAQVFGGQYGGDSAEGYLKALHDAMDPVDGYKMERNDTALNLDPGSFPSYIVESGCQGYSFKLHIVPTNFGDEASPLIDYHIECRDIRVFTSPNCGPGIPNDPTFATTDSQDGGIWYPNTCAFPVYNAPRGRVGVPTDPLMCLLLEGACPAPSPSLSDQYDYPYVYSRIVLVPPSDTSGSHGPVGGPVLEGPVGPGNRFPPLLKDAAPTNPGGNGRTYSPPGLSAFRRYLAEDGVYEAVSNSNLSDVQTVVFNDIGTVTRGTIVYQIAPNSAACPACDPNNPNNCIAGHCTGNEPCCTPVKCPGTQTLATSMAFSDGYYGNYHTQQNPNGRPRWDSHGVCPSVGTGLKQHTDSYQFAPYLNGNGDPFTWAGPFASEETASISVKYYVCSQETCGLPSQGPGAAPYGTDAGWVQLGSYPNPLRHSIYWSWPPSSSQQAPPNTSAGVQLAGTFNWDGSKSSPAAPALIKVGTNGFPEAYFPSQPTMQWANQGWEAYNPSGISWGNQWPPNNSPSEPWFYPNCQSGTPGGLGAPPQNGYGQSWGGGAIVPYLGSWTDYFVNLGGAPNVALLMYPNNYSSSGPSGGNAYGPCPSLNAKSQALFGFDPFIKVTNWPTSEDPVAQALLGSGVTDVSLEGYFSQGLIPNIMADVSTVIQYGLLHSDWNSGYGFDYYTNALGTTLPFGPDSLFQKPSLSYQGKAGNAFVQTLLENSLGYDNNRGSFTNDTQVKPIYCTTYSDRFKGASPDLSFTPKNAYFQWNLGVPTISSVSDIDGDGCVGSNDLTMLLAAWGACGKGNCPEDLNQDGIVEGADLVYVLAEWGVGCGSP